MHVDHCPLPNRAVTGPGTSGNTDSGGPASAETTTTTSIASPLLTSHEAADYLRISREWLEKMRVIGRSAGRGGAPRFVRIGRRVFYRLDELNSFINDNMAASTSEY